MNTKNPKWLDSAVFYEIYPQTFCDTNGDGIGDFAQNGSKALIGPCSAAFVEN